MPFRASAPVTGDWRHFRFEVDDGLALLTFARPERLNALTFDVYADLRDLLAELPHRGDTRCLVITGEGRGFCSGGDVDAIIGELVGMPAGELLEFTRMTGSVVQRLREIPIPVIAAVNGTAAGAGAVIALAADLRVVSTAAGFRFLFTHVGLSGGDMGAAYLLPRVVGLGRATEILLFGAAVDAERALAIGLANRTVEPDDADGRGNGPRPAAGRWTGAGLCVDQGAADPGAGHEPGRRHRARGHDPGPSDGHRGLRRVPRRLHRQTAARVEGAVNR